MSLYKSTILYFIDELKPDLNNGNYLNLQNLGSRGLYQQGLFDGFSPKKLKKAYALFNPTQFNPNQRRSRGFWEPKMFNPVKRGSGYGSGFGYDNPNQVGARGLWNNMLGRVRLKIFFYSSEAK